MNGYKRKRIRESALVLTGALERIRKVYEEEQAALDRIPYSEEYESERDNQEEIVDKLEETISGLEEAIEALSDAGFRDVPAGNVSASSAPITVPLAEPAAKFENASSTPEAPVALAPAKEEKNGCLGWFFALVLPLILAGPLTALLISAYLEDGDFINLMGVFLILIVYIVFVRGLAKKLTEPFTPSATKRKPHHNLTHVDHSAGDEAGAYLGAMLGGFMLGKAMDKKRKSSSDKWHDDIFWQEKYRRHDDNDEFDW